MVKVAIAWALPGRLDEPRSMLATHTVLKKKASAQALPQHPIGNRSLVVWIVDPAGAQLQDESRMPGFAISRSKQPREDLVG
jgi:hypothetical protein